MNYNNKNGTLNQNESRKKQQQQKIFNQTRMHCRRHGGRNSIERFCGIDKRLCINYILTCNWDGTVVRLHSSRVLFSPIKFLNRKPQEVAIWAAEKTSLLWIYIALLLAFNFLLVFGFRLNEDDERSKPPSVSTLFPRIEIERYDSPWRSSEGSRWLLLNLYLEDVDCCCCYYYTLDSATYILLKGKKKNS